MLLLTLRAVKHPPMPNFDQLRAICNSSTAFSKIVIDDFLMPYAAQREGLVQEMDQRLARFTKITRGFQQSWINMLKAQYIAHRIFKKEGLIKKYSNHTMVKALPPQEQSYLKEQSEVPWRYSYSVITNDPDHDFYEMEDIFSGESYLLYSPSISQILAEGPVSLWFNLIGFNGLCWQSFGPVINFMGLEADDIFFFATELNPQIATEEDLMADIEKNPIPYLMLINGSRFPFTVSGEYEIVQLVAEHELGTFVSSKLKDDFKVEYAKGIYRITSPDELSEPPHFATAYYAEDRKTMLLTALTEPGFRSLVARLNKHGLGLSTEPDIRVHLPMLVLIKDILGKEIRLNPYDELFNAKPSAGAKEGLDKLNQLLRLALPIINAGQEPDVSRLAKEAGVDEDSARELLDHALGRIKTLKSQVDKKKKK
jgi:hypothetical protein